MLLATGARDLLVDQERCLILENGTTKLSGITGTGCMVGALTAAYLAQKDPFTAAVLGTSVMGIRRRTGGTVFERPRKLPDRNCWTQWQGCARKYWKRNFGSARQKRNIREQ